MIGCVGIAIYAHLTHPVRQVLSDENEVAGERLRPLLAVEYADGWSVRPARMPDLPAVHVARRSIGIRLLEPCVKRISGPEIEVRGQDCGRRPRRILKRPTLLARMIDVLRMRGSFRLEIAQPLDLRRALLGGIVLDRLNGNDYAALPRVK